MRRSRALLPHGVALKQADEAGSAGPAQYLLNTARKRSTLSVQQQDICTLKACSARVASAMEAKCTKAKPRGWPVNLSFTMRTSRTGATVSTVAPMVSALQITTTCCTQEHHVLLSGPSRAKGS